MARQLSVDECCDLIDVLLRAGYPSIEAVARLLCFSPRTFQRLLNEAGVSYSDLLDRCRCKAACQALEHTQQSIKDIAAALGYSDPTHFTRAFRRWAGVAPRAYRHRSLGLQGNRLNEIDRGVKANR